MQKTWKIRDSNPAIQKDLASRLNISKITAQVLANRGIANTAEASDFLNCSLASCHDPFLLKDMDKAVGRIRKALKTGELVLVYGDYDVDGMTGVALVFDALKRLGGNVEAYIPNRLEEGYGLNIRALKKAEKNGVRLVITVDCGITSFKEIKYANASQIDVIITDHHEILGSRIPNALAVINPLQEKCPYPFKHLAGVGLAYKLAKALYTDSPYLAEDFLDLVSLGTVADIVPLVGENRVLTKQGLRELNRTHRVGLRALIEISGLDGKEISSGHIGFMLGPRINAMGRVGSPQKSLDLLLTADGNEARMLAKVLDTENRNRQKIEERILQEALAKVDKDVNFKYTSVIVLASDTWHPGVIGIVASRLVDRYHRPAILISLEGKTGKGSGRSTERFHLFDYVSRCKDILMTVGGHESACGLTIEKDRVDEFRERINGLARDAARHAFTPELEIDMEIPLGILNEAVIAELENLQPFGEENPRPVLSSRNLLVKDAPRQIGKNGFKMWVTDNTTTCEAVHFGRGNLSAPRPGQEVDVAYTPSMNNWQGLNSIQLEIRDLK